jgi:type II secretory pathway pseudopilin PulG
MYKKYGFTLLEVLIVVVILILLSIIVLTILNPVEYLKKSRDSRRFEDLAKLSKSIIWFQADTQSKEFMGSSSVIYTSLPDNNQNCQSWNLPTPTSGWSYNCVPFNNLYNTDGTGWIPINFNKLSFGRVLNKLPVDPLNNSTAYYTYVYDSLTNNFEINAILESSKNNINLVNDGGDNNNIYEVGTRLTLSPVDIGGTQNTQINSILKIIGSTSSDEIAYDFVNTSDNGFIIVGQMSSGPFGNSDIILVKLNSSFNIVWKKILGTSSSEYAKSIIKNNNNNYFVLVPGVGSGINIFEINEDGQILQSKKINVASGGLMCKSIIMSSDYKYVLACNDGSDIYILKLNYDLSLNWGKMINSGFNELGFDVKEKSNGNLIIVGNQTNINTYISLVEFTSAGNLVKNAVFTFYAGGSNYSAYPNSLIILDDNSIIIGGQIYINSAASFYSFILKIDSNMNSVLWNKIFNASNLEDIKYLHKTGSNYLAIGTTKYSGNNKILIMKLDSSGNVLDSKMIGSLSNNYGYAIKEINNFYYFVGRFYYNTNLDFIFGKINTNLNINSCSILNNVTVPFTNYSLNSASGPGIYNLSSLSVNDFSYSSNSSFDLLDNNQCQD